ERHDVPPAKITGMGQVVIEDRIHLLQADARAGAKRLFILATIQRFAHCLFQQRRKMIAKQRQPVFAMMLILTQLPPAGLVGVRRCKQWKHFTGQTQWIDRSSGSYLVSLGQRFWPRGMQSVSRQTGSRL